MLISHKSPYLAYVWNNSKIFIKVAIDEDRTYLVIWIAEGLMKIGLIKSEKSEKMIADPLNLSKSKYLYNTDYNNHHS
ncbi:MAG: hypothetical protein ACP5NW_00505 [Candidatus Woesearchaeota archaeon]